VDLMAFKCRTLKVKLTSTNLSMKLWHIITLHFDNEFS
jgi:hypothetical protein